MMQMSVLSVAVLGATIMALAACSQQTPGAANKRLREEFAKLQVEINDEKSSGVPTPAYG
jgi:uncharacterized OsmC-like protein